MIAFISTQKSNILNHNQSKSVLSFSFFLGGEGGGGDLQAHLSKRSTSLIIDKIKSVSFLLKLSINHKLNFNCKIFMLNSLLNNKICKWKTNERIFQQNPSFHVCILKDGLCYPLILFIVMLQVVKVRILSQRFVSSKRHVHLIYWYQVIQHLLTKINYYSQKLFCGLMQTFNPR